MVDQAQGKLPLEASLWAAVRAFGSAGSFTRQDIADFGLCPEAFLVEYLDALTAAGILRPSARRQNAFLLVHDPGPKALLLAELQADAQAGKQPGQKDAKQAQDEPQILRVVRFLSGRTGRVWTSEVMDGAGLSASQAYHVLNDLRRAGYLKEAPDARLAERPEHRACAPEANRCFIIRRSLAKRRLGQPRKERHSSQARDRMWAAMRQLGRFSLGQVRTEADAPYSACRNFIATLHLNGVLNVVDRQGGRNVYELDPAAASSASRPPVNETLRKRRKAKRK